MGATASKSATEPERQAGENAGETTFFAPRDANSPVVFSESLISHLSSSTSSTSASTSPSAVRQSTLDAHIQQRIASELTRLRAEEQLVRAQIEQALERENLDRERGTTIVDQQQQQQEGQEKGAVAHSASLLRDLELLQEKVEISREESRKAKENVAWSAAEQHRSELMSCLQENKERPLDCQSKVTAFLEAVAGVESAFVTALP